MSNLMLQRDGELVSLWQDTTHPYIAKKHENFPRKFDVIIVGGGITGISTATLLQEAGKKCAVLEAHSLCYGTTGGTTAHLNTILDTPYNKIISNFGKENAIHVAHAARAAIALIKKNMIQYDIECEFEDNNAYLFAQTKDQEQELAEIANACHEVGVITEFISHIPMQFTFDKAIQIPMQAKFHPTKYVMSLAEEFEKMGGYLIENCRVQPAENNDPIKLNTTKGEFVCDQLIYASHIPPGVNFLSARLAAYRSYAIAFQLEHNNYPEGLVYDMFDPYHYFRTQKIDHKNYLIAGGEDHKTGLEENLKRHFLKLESLVMTHFSVREISYKWSSQYFESTDGLAYIGHMPGEPGNIFVATGFGGNGMIYSQIAALLFRNLLLNDDDPNIKLFDPNRIKLLAGFKNFVKENAEVVKEWLGKFLPVKKLNELADIAPGEARVVKIENKNVALYKDENGALHAVNPTCTHLQCKVHWNNAEISWDCPCHGSRFSYDGRMLNGPADINLEKINLLEEIETNAKNE